MAHVCRAHSRCSSFTSFDQHRSHCAGLGKPGLRPSVPLTASIHCIIPKNKFRHHQLYGHVWVASQGSA
jgi:hypothetical protein